MYSVDGYTKSFSNPGNRKIYFTRLLNLGSGRMRYLCQTHRTATEAMEYGEEVLRRCKAIFGCDER